MEKFVLRRRAARRPGHVKSDPRHGTHRDTRCAAVALPEREELMSSRDDRDELARPEENGDSPQEEENGDSPQGVLLKGRCEMKGRCET